MKIPVDDIKTSPLEVHFTEEVEELNRLLIQDGDADYRLTSPLQISTVHMRSEEELLFTGTIRGEDERPMSEMLMVCYNRNNSLTTLLY